MKYNQGYGYMTGFMMGGIAGAATALLMAPASGVKTRNQIRLQGENLKNRGEVFGTDSMKQTRKIVKQGQKQVANAQERSGHAIEEQRDYLRELIDAVKLAATKRKEELVNGVEEAKAKVYN